MLTIAQQRVTGLCGYWKQVMEVTGARQDEAAAEPSLHTTQPQLRTLLQERPFLPLTSAQRCVQLTQDKLTDELHGAEPF